MKFFSKGIQKKVQRSSGVWMAESLDMMSGAEGVEKDIRQF